MSAERSDLTRIKEIVKQNKMYVVLGVTVVVAGIYLFLFIFPAFSKFLTVHREVQNLKDEIELVNGRVKMINNMTEKLEALELELESYSKGLPGQKEIPEFLEELSSVAKVSGVKILSITPSELKEAKSVEAREYYGEMPVFITAESGYHQLGFFINNIESGERFILVEDLNIQHNAESPRKHDVMLTLKTYVSNV